MTCADTSRAYLCEIEGEEETVEARSLEAAQRACGGPEECLCEEPQALTTTARRATR